MSRLTISLEPHLARQLDSLVSTGGYANRSAAVREMIRFGLDRADLLGLSTFDDEGRCIAHVSFVCTHREPWVAARLIRLLHHNKALVKSSSRIPLDDEHFLEIVILAGMASAVKACADEISSLRGVNDANVRLSVLDAGKKPIAPGLLQGACPPPSLGHAEDASPC